MSCCKKLRLKAVYNIGASVHRLVCLSYHYLLLWKCFLQVFHTCCSLPLKHLTDSSAASLTDHFVFLSISTCDNPASFFFSMFSLFFHTSITFLHPSLFHDPPSCRSPSTFSCTQICRQQQKYSIFLLLKCLFLSSR